MKITNAISAMALLASFAATTLPAQTYREHEEAKRAQDRSDKRHHTTAKVVGGSAAGGAVVGGLMGGGKGALIGGAVGAGGGALADKARKNHDVKKREETGRY